MADGLPATPDSAFWGQVGENIIRAIFGASRIIATKTGGGIDIGIDVDCRLPATGERQTNRVFKVQVKFTKTWPRIKKETLNFWAREPHPVFLFWLKINPESKLDWEMVKSAPIQYKRYPSTFNLSEGKKYKTFDPGDPSIFISEVDSLYEVDEQKEAKAYKKSPRVHELSQKVRARKTLKSQWAEIQSVLENISGFVTSGNSLTDYDKTRLFLFSSALIYFRNIASEVFGIHEINLLYSFKTKVHPTGLEEQLILRTVISDSYSLCPGWYWFSKRTGLKKFLLFMSYFVLTDLCEAVVIGSLDVLDVFWRNEHISLLKRSRKLVTDQIRLKELDLLQNHPSPEALAYCRNFLTGQSKNVTEKAMQVFTFLITKFIPKEAVGLLFSEKNNYDKYKIDPEFYSKLDEGELRRLILHEEADVRVDAFNELVNRKCLSFEELLTFVGDKEWNIRYLVARALLRDGMALNIEQIRSLLTFKEGEYLTHVLMARHSEFREEDLTAIVLGKCSVPELWDMLKWDLQSDQIYIALANKDQDVFSRVRTDLLDGFRDLRKQLLAKTLTPDFSGKKLQEYEQFVENRFIIVGLSLILRSATSDPDRKIAYKYLNNDDRDISRLVGEILLKTATVEDISTLHNLAEKNRNGKFILKAVGLSTDKVKAVTNLIKSGDQQSIITGISYAYQNNILLEREILLDLISSENDNVRKFMAFYIVCKYDRATLSGIIRDYYKKKSYYYNVITIFDKLVYAPSYLRKKFHEQYEKEITKHLGTM